MREFSNPKGVLRLRQRAMTLTETATSTACVAILLAVIATSAAEFRREAKEIRCLSNLGRIAAASMAYAQTDPGELAVPIHATIDSTTLYMLQRGYGGKSGIGEPFAGGDPLSSKHGTLEGMGPATRPLNQVLYKNPFPEHAKNPGTFGQNWLDDTNLDLDVYRCPGDIGYTGRNYLPFRDSGLSAYDHYGTSYIPLFSFVFIGGNPLRSISSFARPISRIPVPSETLLYMETNGQFAPSINYATEGCYSVSPPPPADTVIEGWHGRAWTFSSTFADGHVRPVRMEGHISPSPFLGRYPNCSDDDLDYCHWYWRCVIYRGPDWRLDTLPAPPVQTNINWNGSSGIPIG